MVNLKQKEIVFNEIRRAGQVLMNYWPGNAKAHGSSQGRFEIKKKGDGSAVTTADLESNAILIAALNCQFPNERIYSEESPLEPQKDSSSLVWIIDPLDGTQTFIDGNDDFSILVARCEDGDPTLGVLYFPAKNLFIETERGVGTTINGQKIAVSAVSAPRRECTYVRNFEPNHSNWTHPKWVDSGMALLNVARGVFDGAVIKIVNHKEWDLAAPTLAIEEAGGKVTDENGHPLKFKGSAIEIKYYVASNGLIHSELLSLISK